MFISNIISKLPAIIYKPGIIYKAITTPINKDQHPRSTNINTSSIEPLYTTCSHTQHTATSFSLSLSLSLSHSLSLSLFPLYELHYSIYFLYSAYTYFYLSARVLCFVGPPSC